jgi:hypothetical protein
MACLFRERRNRARIISRVAYGQLWMDIFGTHAEIRKWQILLQKWFETSLEA